MIFHRRIRKDSLVVWSVNNILPTKDQIRAVLRLALRLHPEAPLQVISNRPTTTAYMWPTLAEFREVELAAATTIRRAESPTTSSANSKSKAWILKRSYAVISPRNTAPWLLNRPTKAYRARTMPRLSKESSSSQKHASSRVSKKVRSQYNNSSNSVVSKAFLDSKTVLISGSNNNNCHLRF